jgi:hypothetical protein
MKRGLGITETAKAIRDDSPKNCGYQKINSGNCYL